MPHRVIRVAQRVARKNTDCVSVRYRRLHFHGNNLRIDRLHLVIAAHSDLCHEWTQSRLPVGRFLEGGDCHGAVNESSRKDVRQAVIRGLPGPGIPLLGLAADLGESEGIGADIDIDQLTPIHFRS